MTSKKVETLLKKIEATKTELLAINNMRPGSVTEQIHKRGNKKWPFWQISYTHKKKSRTDYIKDEFVQIVKDEVLNYKNFKNLVEKLITFNIELSKEKLKILRTQQ